MLKGITVLTSISETKDDRVQVFTREEYVNGHLSADIKQTKGSPVPVFSRERRGICQWALQR